MNITTKAKDTETLILAAIRTTLNNVYDQYSTNQAGASKLMSSLNIGVLLERMGQTEVAAQVVLAALIDFVQHGGQYSEIRLDDIRPFQAVMQGRERLYKSDLMGISKTDVGHLFGVMRQLKNDDSHNMFVIMALQ